MGNYVVLDERASDFDKTYVGGGHGGNPVNSYYPKGHGANGEEGEDCTLKNFSLELPANKTLERDVFHFSGIPDIKNIGIRFSRKGKHSVEITKISFSESQADKTITGTTDDDSDFIDLMDYRTMFVGYKDTYTNLKFLAWVAEKGVTATLEINKEEEK